jgi:hypothetical protein
MLIWTLFLALVCRTRSQRLFAPSSYTLNSRQCQKCKYNSVRVFSFISFIQQWLYSPLFDPDLFFSFVILVFFYTVGRIPWTIDQPFARPLPTHRTTQTQNEHTRTSMPWVGFEPRIPVLEPAKMVHALDRVATVIGVLCLSFIIGRAIPQAVSRRLLTAAARVQTRFWSCGILWWIKVARGRFSPRTWVSPANLHSICFSTIIFTITLASQTKKSKKKE